MNVSSSIGVSLAKPDAVRQYPQNIGNSRGETPLNPIQIGVMAQQSFPSIWPYFSTLCRNQNKYGGHSHRLATSTKECTAHSSYLTQNMHSTDWKYCLLVNQIAFMLYIVIISLEMATEAIKPLWPQCVLDLEAVPIRCEHRDWSVFGGKSDDNKMKVVYWSLVSYRLMIFEQNCSSFHAYNKKSLISNK